MNDKPVKKLARRRAYLRGLYRRVILPTKFICFCTTLALCINIMFWARNGDELHSLREKAAIHLQELDQVAAIKNREIASREQALEKKEQEFDKRLQTFEDTARLMSILMKDSDLKKDNISEVLKRSGIKKN